MKIRVTINGTDKNSFKELWGLKQNPFPQIAMAEWDWFDRLIHSLNGDPIPNEEALRERIGAHRTELFEICRKHYKPGERITFILDIPQIKE